MSTFISCKWWSISERSWQKDAGFLQTVFSWHGRLWLSCAIFHSSLQERDEGSQEHGSPSVRRLMKLVSAKTFQKLGSHPAWLPLNRKVECWICCLPQLYRQVAGVCLNDSNIFWRTCHSWTSIPPWSHPKILGLQVIDMLLSWKRCPINGITSSNVRIFRRNTETSFKYLISAPQNWTFGAKVSSSLSAPNTLLGPVFF